MYSPLIRQSSRLFLGMLMLLVFSVKAQNTKTLKSQFKANQIQLDQRRNPKFIEFQKGTKKDFLPQVKSQLLGHGDFDFKSKSVYRDAAGNTHERMVQTFNGIEILGGDYIFHYRGDELIAANGRIQNEFGQKTKPAISEDKALQIALNKVGGTLYMWDLPDMEKLLQQETGNARATYFPKAKLVYTRKQYENTNPLVLAYLLDIYVVKPLGRFQVEVDATTGEIINSYNKIHTSDVERSGQSKYNGTVVMTVDSTGSTYRLSETTRGSGVYTYSLNNGSNYTNAILVSDSDGFFGSDEVAVSAHFGAQATYDLYAELFNRLSYNDEGAAINSYVHYGYNYANAFWDGQRMTYGDGNGDSMEALVSLDIVGHEITHAVTEYSAGLYYSYESGALNESFSDIFGQAVEYYSAPETASWNLGDEIFTDGVSMIRSMSNPKQEGQPDTYNGENWFTGIEDNGGVHYNSGVQNYWFYLLVEGGMGINDFGYSYNVSGIGWDDAIQIAYRNLTVYLTSTSDYSDARAGSELAAIDLFGRNSVQYQSVVAAWDAVAVPASYPLFTLPDSVDFGVTLAGHAKNASFQVYNSGSGSIAIYGIMLTGDFELKSDSVFNLSEGSSETIFIASKALESIGEYNGSMTFYTNLDTATVALKLSVVEGPSIQIAPEDFEFEVIYGDAQTQNLEVTNNSAYDVNLNIDKLNQSDYQVTYQKTDRLISNGKQQDFLYRAVPGLSGKHESSGYTWRDSEEGAVYDWFDITNLGTAVYLGDDSNTSFINLGFDFEFFDKFYSAVSISSNGWVSFESTIGMIWNYPLPSVEAPPAVISWMAGDLYPGSGSCLYYEDKANDRFIIQYNNWTDYGGQYGKYTVQIQLLENGTIKILYQQILNPVEGTVGIQDASRTEGITVSYYNTSFFKNRYAIEFSKGVNWLEVNEGNITIAANTAVSVPLSVKSDGLSAGDYESELLLWLTDFDLIFDTISVDLSVIGSPNLQEIQDVLFDTLLIGDTSYLWIPFVNIGSDDLVIDHIVWSDQVNFFIQDSLNVSVAPGASQDIGVGFSPKAEGFISSEVFIYSNDPVDSVYTFNISGIGALPPVFVLTQDSINIDLFTGGVYNEEIFLDNTAGGSSLTWEAKIVYVQENQSVVKKAPIGFYAEEALTKLEEPLADEHHKDDQYAKSLSSNVLYQFPYRSRGMVNVGDSIYVADYNNYRVYVYNVENQQYVNSFSTNSRPYGITYAEGYIWVTSSSGYVTGYTLEGSLIGSFYVPTYDAVAITYDGEYFLVTDQYESGPIYRLDFDGSIIETYENAVTDGYIVAFQYAHKRLFALVNNWNTGSDELRILELHLGSWTSIETAELPVQTFGYGIGMDEDNFYYAPYYNYSYELYVLENNFINTWMDLSRTSGTVPAGSSESITVRADPGNMNGGVYKGLIEFITNDPLNARDEILVTLNLTGAPDLFVESDSMFLGEIFLGDSSYLTLDIYNNGNDSLRIADIAISHEAFHLLSPDSIAIAPDEKVVIQMLWLPQSIGNNDAVISVSSNDPDDSIHLVHIYAATLAAPVMVVKADTLAANLYSQRSQDVEIIIDNTNGGSNLTWNSELKFDHVSSLYGKTSTPVGFYSKREKTIISNTPDLPKIERIQYNEDPSDVIDSLPGAPDYVNCLKVVGDTIYFFADYYLYQYSISTQTVVNYTYFSDYVYSIEIADNKIWLSTYGEVQVLDMSFNQIGSFNLPTNDNYAIAYFNDHIFASYIWGTQAIYELDFDGSIVNTYTNPSINILDLISINGTLYVLTFDTNQIYSNLLYALDFSDGQPTKELTQSFSLGNLALSIGYNDGNFYLSPVSSYSFYKVKSHLLSPWFALNPSFGIVGAGESESITLRFSSTKLKSGLYNGLINLYSDDPFNRQEQLEVQLTVEESSKIIVNADQLEFGQVFATDTAYTDFTIQNSGVQDLALGSIIANNSDYHIGEYPASLKTGEMVTIDVSYIPTAVEDDNSLITIYSNDPIDSVLIVSLIGEGTEPPVLVYAPDSIYHQLFVGEKISDQIDLTNSGLSDLTYSIAIKSFSSSELVGQWELYFDYGCTGQPGYIVLDFHEDHSYTDLNGYAYGEWNTYGDSLVWGFYNVPDNYYAGIFESSNAASGSIFYDNRIDGCWQMFRYEGVTRDLVHDESIKYEPASKDPQAVSNIKTNSFGQNVNIYYEGELSGVIDPQSTVSGVLNTDVSESIGGIYDYVMEITTNDPAHKKAKIPVRIEITGFPELELSTDHYEFGSLFQNDTAYASIGLINSGSDVLIIDSIHWDNTDFTVVSFDSTINAYSSAELTILYQPTEVENDSTLVTIYSNSTSGEEQQLWLFGMGTYAPVLKLDKSVISESLYTFGSASHEIQLDNSEGHSPLSWSANIRYLKDQDVKTMKAKTPIGFYSKRSKEIYLNPDSVNAEVKSDSRMMVESDSILNFFYYSRSKTIVGDLLYTTNGSYVYTYDLKTGYYNSYYMGYSCYGIAYAEGYMWVGDSYGTIRAYDENWNIVGDFDIPSYDRSVFDYNGEYFIFTDFAEVSNIYHLDFDGSLLSEIANPLNYSYNGIRGLTTFDDIVLVLYGDGRNEYQVYVLEYSDNYYQIADTLDLGYSTETFDGLAYANDHLYVGKYYSNYLYRYPFEYNSAWLSMSDYSGIIAADSSLNINLYFEANRIDQGQYHAIVDFYSNDPLNRHVEIPVTLEITNSGSLVLQESTLDFGEIFVGADKEMEFVIFNNGNADLEISSITTDNTDFTSGVNQIALSPREKAFVSISFEPSVDGEIIGKVLINSNDPNSGVDTIFVRGYGIAPPVMKVDTAPVHTDLYVGESKEIEVLIDNTEGKYDLNWKAQLKFYFDNEKSIVPIDFYASVIDPGQGKVEVSDARLGDEPTLYWETSYIDTLYNFSYYQTAIDKVGDTIFVANNGYGRVDMYDVEKQTIVSSFYTEVYPYSITVLDEVIWVSNSSGNTILGYDYSGHRVGGFNQNYNTSGISLTNDGEYLLIIPKSAPQIIYQVNYDGTLKDAIVSDMNATNLIQSVKHNGSLYSMIYVSEYGKRGVISSRMKNGKFVKSDTLLVPEYYPSAFDIDEEKMYITANYNNLAYVLDAEDFIGLWAKMEMNSGVVYPGENANLKLKISAENIESGAYYGALQLTSNDPINTQASIPISLTVADAASIILSSDEFNVGDVFIGQTAELDLLVSNTGSESLNISSISHKNAAITVNSNDKILEPGEVTHWRIAYHPTVIEQLIDTLFIRSNDPNDSEIAFPIFGQSFNGPVAKIVEDSIHSDLYFGESENTYFTLDNSQGDHSLAWSVSISFLEEVIESKKLSDFIVHGNDGNYKEVLPIYLDTIQANRTDITGLVVKKDSLFALSRGRQLIEMYSVSKGELITNIGLPVSSEFLAFCNNALWLKERYSSNYLYSITENGAYLNSLYIGNIKNSNPFLISASENYLYIMFQDELNQLYEINTNGEINAIYQIPVIAKDVSAMAVDNQVLYLYEESPVGFYIKTLRLNEGTNAIPLKIIELDWEPRVGAIAIEENQIFISDRNHFQIYKLENNLGLNWVAPIKWAGEIAAGGVERIQLDVDSYGLNPGEYAAILDLQHNDPNQSSLQLPISLTINSAPTIYTDLDAIHFGDMFVGDSSFASLRIQNKGNEVLNITDITSNSEKVHFEDFVNSLNPGESYELLIQYRSDTVDQLNHVITIQSNDPNDGVLNIPIYGGTYAPPIISVNADTIYQHLYHGDSSIVKLRISNQEGGYPLDWEITFDYVDRDSEIKSVEIGNHKSVKVEVPKLSRNNFGLQSQEANFYYQVLELEFESDHFIEGEVDYVVEDSLCYVIHEFDKKLSWFDFENNEIINSFQSTVYLDYGITKADNLFWSFNWGLGSLIGFDEFGNKVSSFVIPNNKGNCQMHTFNGDNFIVADVFTEISEFKFIGLDGTLKSSFQMMDNLELIDIHYYNGLLYQYRENGFSNYIICSYIQNGSIYEIGRGRVNLDGSASGLYVDNKGIWVSNIHGNFKRFKNPWDNGWMRLTSNQDQTLAAGTYGFAEIEVRPMGLEPRDYFANIVIHSNDPTQPDVKVPVHLLVSDVPLNSAPVLDNLEFFIDENTPVSSQIDQLLAYDKQNDTLVYAIVDGDQSKFSLSEQGVLAIAGEVNFEQQSLYELTVTVSDGEYLDSAFIKINVQDVNEAPMINDATFEIAEGDISNALIGKLEASDEDNDSLEYMIISGDYPVGIVEMMNDGSLYANGKINYEETQFFAFDVIVTDGEFNVTANISVYVKDVNDAPVINPVQLEILENTEVGVVITTLKGFDEDSDQLSYAIAGTEYSDYFKLSSTGELELMQSLNFEMQTQYEINVVVSDGILSDTTMIVVNILDVNEAPTLEDYHFTINENSNNGYLIGKLEGIDQESDELSYRIIEGNSGSAFKLNGGQLMVAAPIDFETIANYKLVIEVSDGVNINIAQVEIEIQNVNESPRLESFELSIDENLALGTELGKIIGTDPDQDDELTYKVINTDNFAMEGTSLVLNTALDFEAKAVYTVEVAVYDLQLLGDTASVTIHVKDVNEAPVLDNVEFLIAENQSSGEFLGQLVATDPESGSLKYSILSGNASKSFLLSSNGELYTAKSFDYEQQNQYLLAVVASDGLLTDTSAVSIIISDVNESPVLEAKSFTVAEDMALSSIIGTINGYDVDGGELSFSIISGNETGKFELSNSGSLKLVGALDFEEARSYNLTVSLSDGELTVSGLISITVTNVNEIPVFDQNSYAFQISEIMSVGTVIGQISAADVDENTSLIYTLTNNANGAFTVNSSGQVLLAKSLDYNIKEYQLEVSVSDGALSASADIKIDVSFVLGSLPSYSLLIYPNPATHKFTISTEENIREVEIFDFSGKSLLIYEFKHPDEGIDVNSLSSGMYLLKIKFSDGFEKIEKLQIRK